MHYAGFAKDFRPEDGLTASSLNYYNAHSNNMHRKKWCLGFYHCTNTIASNAVVITGKYITSNFNVKFMSLS